MSLPFKNEYAWVGIDVGLDGAVAMITQDGFATTWHLPVIEPATVKGKKKGKRYLDEPGVRALIVDEVLGKTKQLIVGIEEVRGRPGQSSVATCSFCASFGLWKGLMLGLEIPRVIVTPHQWQRKMFKGIPKSDPKAMARMAVGQMFPGLDLRKSEKSRVPHEGKVDAVLIAKYMQLAYPAPMSIVRQKQ